MDANFSADSDNHKDSFFRPQRVAAPAARHVSLTVRIRFLHDDPGKPLQNAPKPVVVTPRTQHHALCRNPLTAIVNGVWRAASNRWQEMIQCFRIRISGLLRTAVLAKTGKFLLQRIQITGLVATYQSSVIANANGVKQSRTLLVETPDCRVGLQPPRNNGMHIASAQQGAVLVTGLIFLVILTLIGTTALQSTLLEEKMAGNLRDETLAFQAAEAALRSGERFLEQVTLPEFNGSDGLYHHASCSSTLDPDAEDEGKDTPPCPDPVTQISWNADDSKAIDVSMDGVASQPRYFIEQLPSVPLMGDGGSAQQSGASLNASMFRIVAMGTGGTEAATVLLQSTYRR